MQNITKTIYKSASAKDREAWVFEALRSSLPFIFIAIIIFIGGIFIGFLNQETFEPLSDKLFERVNFSLEGKGFFLTFLLIFIHNFGAALINIFLGFLFGLLPIISSFLNGALMGGVAASLVESKQTIKLLLIVPHGMFELPALFMAWGSGMWFGSYLLRKNKNETFENRRIRSSLLIGYILLLLLLAAIIEASMLKLLN
jgi:stage II sporulation protein M